MAATRVIRTDKPPSGLLYLPDFITELEEAQLLEILEQLPYYDFERHGQAAKRKVFHFGYSYEFYSQHVQKIAEFPEWLSVLRDRAAPLAGLSGLEIEQALVAKYSEGAGIGWHRDAPPFGPTVIGISIRADETMRFRRRLGDNFEMYKQPLARRSLYAISGPARAYWQHSLPPAKSLRYSITFRTVRERFKTADQDTQVSAVKR